MANHHAMICPPPSVTYIRTKEGINSCLVLHGSANLVGAMAMTDREKDGRTSSRYEPTVITSSSFPPSLILLNVFVQSVGAVLYIKYLNLFALITNHVIRANLFTELQADGPAAPRK